MGFEININIIWQSFVIILLPSLIFQIFFLQSKPYRTAFLGEMGGWLLIWVGRLIGVRQELAWGLIKTSIYSVESREDNNKRIIFIFLSVDRILSVIASSKAKP